ncbi:MAG: CaiB/BaiF CoA transferase family protein, partial [Dehalococcoidia bacterium]
MLSPYQVLDLTDSRAELGPMMLADLGATVTKVEPPGGPPLDPDLPPNQAVLGRHVYNRHKRSVTLDLDTEQGREALRRLVAESDFLFENDRPGAMAARGLGFDDLRAVNPRLVYVAITPFGQDGPYAAYEAADLTLAAMGGMVALNGDADRPPVRISVPQAWLHAAAESAVAAMVAHQRRLQTGEAQFVDVSVQAAVFWTNLNASIAHAIQGRDIERMGSMMQLGNRTLRVMFPCRDGEIVIFLNGAIFSRLIPWMAEEGVVPRSWATDEDWATYDVRWLQSQPLVVPIDELMQALEAFAARHTKQELFEGGMALGIFLAPANTIPDVLAIEHLHARGYWQPLTLPDGQTVHAPGPWVRFSGTPITYQPAEPAA